MAAPGCENAPPPSRYEVIWGTAAGWHAETGELTIRTADGAATRDVVCIVTRDAEVYVNDRLSDPDTLTPGAQVRVAGYRDPGPRDRRLVVASVRVERPTPTPSPPDFAARPAAARTKEPGSPP